MVLVVVVAVGVAGVVAVVAVVVVLVVVVVVVAGVAGRSVCGGSSTTVWVLETKRKLPFLCDSQSYLITGSSTQLHEPTLATRANTQYSAYCDHFHDRLGARSIFCVETRLHYVKRRTVIYC